MPLDCERSDVVEMRQVEIGVFSWCATMQVADVIVGLIPVAVMDVHPVWDWTMH
jgi:hypothetical protein